MVVCSTAASLRPGSAAETVASEVVVVVAFAAAFGVAAGFFVSAPDFLVARFVAGIADVASPRTSMAWSLNVRSTVV